MIREWLLALALLSYGALALPQAAPAAVMGAIRSDDPSSPRERLAVRLYAARRNPSEERPLLARGETDAAGAFVLDADPRAAELLQVEGARGTGNVFLARGAPERLAVDYPVKTTVLILHDNDLHFNINHRESFEAEVARLREAHENVFMLNAGDCFIRNKSGWHGRGREFYAERSLAMVQWMNDMRYDALTPGNHDLDYVGNLTRDALRKAEFPLLAANVRLGEEAALPELRPYTVLRTKNDLSFFVLGLSTVNFRKPGVEMLDPLHIALKYKETAARHSARVILSHLGYYADRAMALSGIGYDIIVGGHTHTLLAKATSADGILIAQAGGTPSNRRNPVDPARPKYLGIIKLEFENERLVEKSGKVLTFK